MRMSSDLIRKEASVLVRSTRPGYSNFSRSLSVADISLTSVTDPTEGVDE